METKQQRQVLEVASRPTTTTSHSNEYPYLKVILQTVSLALGFTINDLRGVSRKRELVDARKIYCLIASTKTGASLKEIGMVIDKDHATVIHGTRKARWHIEQEVSFAEKYERCLAMMPPKREFVKKVDAELSLAKQVVLLRKENQSLLEELNRLKEKCKQCGFNIT